MPRRVTSSKNLTAWGPELREAQWEGIPSPHARTPEPSSSWIQTGNYFKMVVKEDGGLHEILPEVARNSVPEGTTTRDSMSSRGRIDPG
ncbi:hypothetical protein PCANC_12277 [Puccinia coronata f. sp. avenae]|uniref:Uncharacterized protein n=1 Tax=Puccinia coronata f. sp. avenae TaxID=200324 RepID=A0A2N5SZ69_9BASI|nr:hypothetical protein PCANC_12277 [Puccinia coronata f. sp. avenae]